MAARTNHGTANQAIEFVVWAFPAPGEEPQFLRAWQCGDLSEWPEYYRWLDAPASPDTEAKGVE